MLNKIKTFLKWIIPPFALSAYHYALACAAALLYWFPSRRLTVIGVTGTDGKSTTVEMITSVLRAQGLRVASTSSVRFQIGEKTWRNTLKMGMPGRFLLQKFLRDAVRAGCTHAVIEVSSEGVLQHRHRCIAFRAAVWTNLFPEHIERHGSFTRYRTAKLAFVKSVQGVHVINTDDEYAPYFLHCPARETFTFGIKDAPKDSRATHIRATDIRESKESTRFYVGDKEFSLKLLGKVNVYNALATICVGLSEGISLDTISLGLLNVERMRGRMDLVVKEPFGVLIDYAVTPKALRNLYETCRRIFQPSRLICVLGACGGGRDKWKRPVLGKIAGEYCDTVILTNEDPYDENPEAILEQIASGFSQNIPLRGISVPSGHLPQGDRRETNYPPTSLDFTRDYGEAGKTQTKYEKILDRREAIRKALSLARPGDLVALSGKGSEDMIALADGKKIPWNEEEVVKEELSLSRG